MLNKISIENYKSIEKVEIDIKDINILIGSNGAGKSNFISFFKLLNSIVKQKLQSYVAEESGANNVFHHGLKNSEFIKGEFDFNSAKHHNIYSFTLNANKDGGVYFDEEIPFYKHDIYTGNYSDNIASGNFETNLFKNHRKADEYLINRLQEFRLYHFHDTGKTALVKQSFNIQDNEFLYEDARNLASFLFRLSIKEPRVLEKIEKTIKLIAPYFDKFILKPDVKNEESIKLSWQEKDSDMLFNASHLSDGTLRMICLITLFLQPNPPKIILLDEPELGLHPFALTVLSDLIKGISAKGTQVIISTQSVPLIENFTINDIIIVEKEGKKSIFKRPDMEFLKEWIDEYTLGELWEMNLLGGRP